MVIQRSKNEFVVDGFKYVVVYYIYFVIQVNLSLKIILKDYINKYCKDNEYFLNYKYF